ncbi:MAG: CDP-alcohol phosphatidyltransferase family protein [Chloroflexota bacterium]
MIPTEMHERNSNEKPTLTDFLRARTKFIIDPIVTFFARYRLSPDAITIAGLLVHFLFAWLVANGEMRIAAVAIFILGPLDALDGALARKLGRKKGGFGAFLDSTLDRLAEIVLFGGFILFFVNQDNLLMLALSYIAISGSLMVSYARARAEALGYSSKIGLMSRVERYGIITIFLVFNQPEWVVIILAIFTYITVGQRMYHVWKQAKEQSA